MAKGSNKTSILASEDKRFIKRVGIFLFIFLLASGAIWYFYYEKRNQIGALQKLDGLLNIGSDSLAAETSKDSIAEVFGFDDIPDIPDIPDVPDVETFQSKTSKPDIGPLDDFDEQAHLQLMRINVKEYNYKQAYKHGFRIESYLLAKSKLSAEWGSVLLEAGLPTEANSLLQNLKSKDSIKGESIIDLAFAMHRSKFSDEAISYLDSLLIDKNDVDLIAVKASIIGDHSDTTKRSGADQVFKLALKINQNSHRANYLYGRYLMQKGDFKSSKTHLELALKENSSDPRYVARLGMADFYLKNDSNAETLYKKALQINPYDYNTWFNLGELYLSQANEATYSSDMRKKVHQALEAYLKAVEQEPMHSNAHFRIGVILNGNAERTEAIKHLYIALEQMPRNISIMQQLSSAHMHLQDTAKSLEFLEKILQIDPFNKIAATEYNRIKKNERN